MKKLFLILALLPLAAFGQSQFAKVGGIASPGTSEGYAAFIAAEQAKWSRIVQAIGFEE